MLSAQCTDVRVNQVTPELFRECRRPEDYLALGTAGMEKRIRSTGFFRNKAKSILGACAALIERFDGEVPSTMEELLTLPGVGRKTANVILGNAFGKEEGIVVDTHVARVSQRLGLTSEKDPVKIEQRPDAALSPRGVDPPLPSHDPAWPEHVHGAVPALRIVHARREVPFGYDDHPRFSSPRAAETATPIAAAAAAARNPPRSAA